MITRHVDGCILREHMTRKQTGPYQNAITQYLFIAVGTLKNIHTIKIPGEAKDLSLLYNDVYFSRTFFFI